jgi:ferritin-like metal-binding protein YciE
MAEETTLRKLFIDELRDAYHAERQLVKALPRLAKAATSPELKSALQDHLSQTEEHVLRLEEAFGLLDEPVKAKPCAGMQGIIEEGSDLIKEEDKGAALDAGIIAGAQRAEHYEMAAYGSLAAWAKALGHDDVADLLQTTLEEEKAADAKLTTLAEAGINAAAAEGDDDGGSDDSEDDADARQGNLKPRAKGAEAGSARQAARPAPTRK